MSLPMDEDERTIDELEASSSSSQEGTPNKITKIGNVMLKETSYEFGDELVINIQQVVDEEYGMFMWPSAHLLAEFLFWNADVFVTNQRVLEIGCGVGLPGIVCACCGALSVDLTDKKDCEEVLENCRTNVKLNQEGFGCDEEFVNVFGLSWGQFDTTMLGIGDQVDLVIGADCFYDAKRMIEDKGGREGGRRRGRFE
eukprot:TRINITY_DN3601_c0_g1_i3.p1 TRINITY_DN3601_c0_g1~~TRINITY_DN3601_c0_g1_i3.p1  ORF type:complete len:210 (-),score=44.39 TRINITY_DN3601_c0_g1_i3:2-595(-)